MVEAFEGLLKFNVWLMILDICLIIWFISNWYFYYKKTGTYINYWYYNMFLVFFVPVLIMYPFSSSILNVFTVHGFRNLYSIEQYTNQAYLITILGFGGAYCGKYLHDRFKSLIEIEILIIPFALTLGKFFNTATKNSLISRLFTLFYILILLGFVAFIIASGLLRNPREFFKINTQYGPIYTFILSTFGIAFAIISTRSLQYNLFIDKALFVALILFGFFLGVRAPIILNSLNFGVLFVLYKKRGYLPIYKVLGTIIITLLVVIFLSFFRNSNAQNGFELEIAFQSFLPEIFYGNTFSDIRDFSWVLGYWDKNLYWGLSYYAAILSFIPSSIYPIRETYGIGQITVNTTGLDIVTHPGLRMGLFGEMYINFGIFGVILFGIIWGYVMRKMDCLTKKFTQKGDVISASSALIYCSFVSYFTVSAGFWSLYISFFLLTILYIASVINWRK